MEMAVAKRPRGRPVGAVNKITHDIQAWAQENAHIAKKALLELCQSEDEKIRLDAVQAVLTRAYGAPKQSLGLDGAAMAVFAGIKIVISDERKGDKGAGD